MYSVVEVAGHQYRVKAGDLVDVQKLSDEVGSISLLIRFFSLVEKKSV